MKITFFLLVMIVPVALAQETQRTVWDGVYSPAQAQRGEAAFVQACSNCHGRTLEGADMTPALTGGAFMANWDGLTVGDLFDRIRISMPADRPPGGEPGSKGFWGGGERSKLEYRPGGGGAGGGGRAGPLGPGARRSSPCIGRRRRSARRCRRRRGRRTSLQAGSTGEEKGK